MDSLQRWVNIALDWDIKKAPWWEFAVSGTLFNLTWLAIVSSQSSVLAPAIVALHLLVHGALVGRLPGELRFVIGVSIFGFLLDQALFVIGVFAGPAATLPAPFWLSCLWPVLATAMAHAFRPLQSRLPLAALMGAVGGTLSYSAGVALTAIAWGSELWGPLIIGLGWSLIFPLLLLIARASLSERSI
jgi:hypothetical protein